MFKKFLLYTILLFGSFNIIAQEYLINIGNPTLQRYSKTYFQIHSNKDFNSFKSDTLELPFFDDFSNSYIYPDSSKWEDNYAFIGHNYAIEPISIGTATLDAIDENGFVYSSLPYGNPGIADYLTSKPINLEYAPEDSIYLSFYFQAGGFGNAPEYSDSLVLEFKVPDKDWTSIWNMPGRDNMQYFELVMIPISDSIWLQNGFQFRFKNYVSLTSIYEPSWASNVDHWHLDFIKIDKDRNINDTLPEDVAFIKNISSLISDFESVPWKHFISSDSVTIADSIFFTVRYMGVGTEGARNIAYSYYIIDRFTDDNIPGLVNNTNIESFIIETYSLEWEFDFSSPTTDSASFEIVMELNPGAEDPPYYRFNDKVKYYQNFFNYYAYDDGTAEAGYGLSGQGAAYSQLAQRYEPLISDTLRGIYIHFNHTLNEMNQKYFFLTVWGDNEGVPGDTLYQQLGAQVQYPENIRGFVYYPIDTILIIDGPFYIGWVQTTDDNLNVGFDRNRVSNQNVFYNVSGLWQNSSIPGSVMMRPVFGSDPYPLSKPQIKSQETFRVYPNPTTGSVNFDFDIEPDMIEIYDINGKMIKSSLYSRTIELSDLPSGMYFIKPRSNTDVFEVQRLSIVK